MDGEMLGPFKVLKRSIGVRIAHNPQNSCKNAFLTNMDFFCSSEKNLKNSKKNVFLRGFLDFVEFFPKTQEKLKKNFFSRSKSAAKNAFFAFCEAKIHAIF